jgi:hypothetical protein
VDVDGPVVHLGHPGGQHGPRVVAYVPASLGAEPGRGLRVGEQPADGVRERHRASGRSEQAVSPIADQAGMPPTSLATTGRPVAIASINTDPSSS